MTVSLIAWDFDGVLNRSVENAEFLWHRDFERDLGVSLNSFTDFHFRSGRFSEVLVGEKDLRDLVGEWIAEEEYALRAEDVLAYWFEMDDNPDREMINLMEGLPQRQIIATNNEARRIAYIREATDWEARVETIFAAGPMGVAKPAPAFFERITNWSGLPATEILLVDDSEENIEVARAMGWQGFHFTDETRGALPRILGAA